MNYAVHSLMYFYFAMTQVSAQTRHVVRPFAPCLTILQLLQMVGGIIVTVASAVYSTTEGMGCHYNATNTLLGLVMYLSYFVLFFELFLDRRRKRQTEQRTGQPTGQLQAPKPKSL